MDPDQRKKMKKDKKKKKKEKKDNKRKSLDSSLANGGSGGENRVHSHLGVKGVGNRGDDRNNDSAASAITVVIDEKLNFSADDNGSADALPSTYGSNHSGGGKRSRPSSPEDGDDSPALVATTSIRLKVSPADQKVDPVVVSFPRGVPSSILIAEAKARDAVNDDVDESTSDGDDAPGHLLFSYSKIKPNLNRGRKIVGLSTEGDADDGGGGRCQYAAAAEGRGHDGRLTKFYVAVYDKIEKKLRLVPTAERGTMFSLEQTVSGYQANVSSNDDMLVGGQGDNSSRKLTAAERRKALFDSFGSKKKQRVLASQAANVVNVNSVVGKGSVMMNSVSSQGGNISETNRKAMTNTSEAVDPVEAALMEARRSFLPHFNENADAPHRVYDAQSIAGANAWNKCSRIVQKALKSFAERGECWIAALLGNGHLPEAIQLLMKSIDASQKGAEYRIKSAFFLFLALRFHAKISRRGFITGNTIEDCIGVCHVPHEVGTRLFDAFTAPMEGDRQGFVASKQLTNKRHVYCLIMYAIASGRELKITSINQLCKDMQLDPKNASALLREAGFVVKKNSAGDMSASLPIPLKFPAPKRVRKN